MRVKLEEHPDEPRDFETVQGMTIVAPFLQIRV